MEDVLATGWDHVYVTSLPRASDIYCNTMNSVSKDARKHNQFKQRYEGLSVQLNICIKAAKVRMSS